VSSKNTRRVVGFVQQGRVRAQLADGSEREFDALIGADGLHSRIRAQLLGEQPVRMLEQSSRGSDFLVGMTCLHREHAQTHAADAAILFFAHALLHEPPKDRRSKLGVQAPILSIRFYRATTRRETSTTIRIVGVSSLRNHDARLHHKLQLAERL
jgi:2-polyprenyl-6-methoxyphenol hydroxylase-like FAD-dependent oxidoreductase